MSWDEALFGFAWEGARKWFSRAEKKDPAVVVQVEPELARLEALARLMSGRPMSVQACDDGGGLDGDSLTVPRVVDVSETLAGNREALLVRVVWAAVLRRLELPAAELSVIAPVVRAALLEECPSLSFKLSKLETSPCDAGRGRRVAPGEGRIDQLEPLTPALSPLRKERENWVWGTFYRPPRERRLAANANGGDQGTPSEPGTELQKKTMSRTERIETPKQDLHENPLVHSFEKVHTLERYQGGSKRMDGDDELSAHQKALDELDLNQVVRSHQRSRGLYRADVLLDGGSLPDDEPPPNAEAVYDEWDEARKQWRRNWCHLTSQVTPVVPEATAALQSVRARMRKTTDGLRSVFEQLEAGRAWKLRQREGSDVDVDAVVDRYAGLRAGHTTNDRLYAHRRRHARELAVLVLLDASLSTDAWVANRRVLDVEKEAVIALGDALDGLFDEVAVAAFCSQSRRDCRFLVAKGLHEPWETGVQRVMSLEPRGFTRIGPAIRHATTKLQECGARQKLLLLVSDGKPSDVDRYEGRYGMADVHRAVLDAQASGVVTHALAVDPSARRWLPSMFGHGRSTVVAKPADLVGALAKVTTSALRGS